MCDIIQTDRLRLRPFELDDAESAHAWFGNDAVMKYTPSGPDVSVEETRERLARYQAHQATHGFSKWLITERTSEQPIGDAGLLVLHEQGWIDLGFRLLLHCWGRGLATEVGAAWISRASGQLGIQSLGAFAHRENVASLRVLEKLGFRIKLPETVVMGMSSILFELDLTLGPFGTDKPI